jgi:hypothetical protein
VKLAAASTNLLGSVLQRSIDERAVARDRRGSSRDVVCANCPVDNVGIGGRDGIKDGFVNAKVLCQD